MANTNSRVFVINEPRATNANPLVPNISPALKYGAIITVFDLENFPMPSEDVEAAIARADSVLADVTESDFLLFAGGDVYGIALVMPIILDRCESIQILKWDFKEKGYIPRMVNWGQSA